MSKGLPKSQSRGPATQQEVFKIDIPLASKALTVDGATGVGFGTVELGGLPTGTCYIVATKADLTFTTASANITADFEGDFAIGSVATDDANVTDSGEADIVASTALAAATAKVSPQTVVTPSTIAVIDNTAGDKSINLNLLIDDADIDADDVAFTVDGRVSLRMHVIA
jgi:hypothetical protein